MSTIVNLNSKVGNKINEKPVLDGDEDLIEVEEAVAASAADLAEVIAIVPPPAVAASLEASLDEIMTSSVASPAFSGSSPLLAIRWIVKLAADSIC